MPRFKSVCVLSCAVLLLATSLPRNSSAATARAIDFNRDIRPILADKCYKCHGPDAKQVKGNLKLDSLESATKPAKSGKVAIVPRQPAKSELVRRITTRDEDDRMPPKESGKTLTAQQVDLLKKWVEQGAAFKPHWAYAPPVRPPIPSVKNTAWPRNPVDHFIAARLDALKLKPSPEADRRTLARRLGFDLTGLPPQPEDVESFVADTDPKAWDDLVDRLLASPRYGERMAEYWLDLVRYADTIGYHSDNPRDIFPYRDYVIDAFNRNLPFDQFTTEQLAGDLLPNPTLRQKVASGYNRLLQTTEEGGAQAKEYESIYMADRVRNVSTVWMASTLGCAQCHDHKFDPFTTRDFYSMASFFADVKEAPIGKREAGILVPDDQQAAELERLEKKIAALKTKLETTTPELAAAQSDWEGKFDREKVADAHTLKFNLMGGTGGTTLELDDDGSIRAGGPNPEKSTYTITATSDLHTITGFRLELLPDEALQQHGPGRSRDGNLTLTDFSVTLNDSAGAKPRTLELGEASASFAQKEKDDLVPAWINISNLKEGGKLKFSLAAGQIGRPSQLVFPLKERLTVGDGSVLTVVLGQTAGKTNTVGRFRLTATTGDAPKATLGLAADDIAAVLSEEPEKRTAAQMKTLARHFRALTPLLDSARKELADTESENSGFLASVPRSLITIAGQPREIRVKPRGNWMDDTGDLVTPAVPRYFQAGAAAGERANRLDLARWLTSPENPLTARVFVNRLWKLYFGQGLAKTLEDVGSQGEPPTHPQLLDWMAVEFRESGWDVKHLIKLMVTSATYRQTSTAAKPLRDRDPYNLLLARQGRFRMDAEMVRDNALAISGLLSDQVGGPSAKPYQPAGYWSYLNFPLREYPQDHGPSLYRRSLYTWWQRSFLHPTMLTFDAPSREECVADRARSNTPQQALVLLNDPVYVEAARVFAGHIIHDGGATTESRLKWSFSRALSRPPTHDELNLLGQLCAHQLDHYRTDADDARKLIAVGESPVPANVDPAELASWTIVARTLLNLSETITRL
jgi:hypothetical protein